MVEPVTTTAAGVWLVHKTSKAAARLLGPATDEAAEALRRFTARRLQNVGRIVDAADAKNPAGAAEGAVPMRVAMPIFEAGSYADEEIVAEYLSGVLASSRTPGGHDDRGVSWSALVSRLSSDQLRLHYLFYSVVRGLFLGRNMTIDEICGSNIYVSDSAMVAAMQVDAAPLETGATNDAFYALHRETLVEDVFYIGTAETLATSHSRAFPEGGIVFRSSAAGLGLYLWGHGFGRGRFVSTVISTEIDMQPAIVTVPVRLDLCAAVDDLPKAAPIIPGRAPPSWRHIK